MATSIEKKKKEGESEIKGKQRGEERRKKEQQ